MRNDLRIARLTTFIVVGFIVAPMLPNIAVLHMLL